MINLIPIEEKKEIRKYFYYRVFTVFFIMLSTCAIIFIISISPSYFISLEKKILTNKKLEVQKNEVMPEIDQQSLASIKDLDTRLTLLEKARKNKYVFSKYLVDEILLQKVPGIKIKRISFINDSLEGKKVDIFGLAQDREQLISFRRMLENDNSFKDIDLPISNFVKGQDIEFNLKLISK
jgi:hypothetical protein